MRYKLAKQSILRNNKQFQIVYRYGKSYANKYMVLYLLPVKDTPTKIGFAAGKRLGNAVVRNRVKRLLRETYRLNKYKLRDNFNLLLVGRKPIVGVKNRIVSTAFSELCIKANILRQ